MKRIGRFLAYINRARQYVGILQSLLVLSIFAKLFELNLKWWGYLCIIPITIVGYLVIGFADTRWGFRKWEIMNIEENSPIRMQDHKRIKEIHDKIHENNDTVKD